MGPLPCANKLKGNIYLAVVCQNKKQKTTTNKKTHLSLHGDANSKDTEEVEK